MKKIFYCTLYSFFLTLSLTAESRTLHGNDAASFVQGAKQLIIQDYSGIPEFILFDDAKQPEAGNPEQWMRFTFKLGTEFGLQLLSTDPDNIGYIHYRYQQTLNGYPVDQTMWLVHVKNGRVVSMNGVVTDRIKTLNQQMIGDKNALAKALSHVNASRYKWQNAEEESALKEVMNDNTATYFPTALITYAHNSKEINSQFRLCYRFDIYAHEPMSRQYIFVDATSGDIVDLQDRIHETNAAGTAVTAYAGTQPIIADNNSGTYRLREAGRGAGQGIETYNLQRTTTYSNTDFTDADNFWNNVNANKDQYATDCHFASEKTYDYFYNTYGRNSINNAGMKLLSYVHYSTNYVNAFWDGSRMTYGDGNATYSPLTTLDIGGHEITHGLTQYTANLTYSYESGALNESFSDCFGTAIEWYADPVHGDWLIGEDIGAAFRSHSNPNAYGDPDTYLGTYWYSGSSDNGGVHTNSGVQNFWFYLLANGGSGTNDIGNAYNVTGITIAKAAAIAFRSLTVYLTSSSNYSAARTYSIQAATDLYGPCSPEVIATTNAWYAVGVGTQSSGGASTISAAGVTDICNGSAVTLNATSVAGSTYQWNRNGNIIAGATTTTHNATQAGTYTITTTGCGASSYTSNSITVNVITVSSTISPAGAASGCTSVLLTAGGTAGYGYQWKNNNVAINGATNSTYTATTSGNYTLTLQATTYPSQNAVSAGAVSIPDNTCTNPAISTINVSGFNGPVNSSGITCTINLTHTYDGDINFMLEAPNGDVIGLSDFAGGAGDNFINTVFSDAGATSVANGTAPFTGTYKPWQALINSCTSSNKIGFGAIGGGTINPNGAWRLRVYDRYSVDIGTINNWSISFPSYSVPTPNCGPVTSAATNVTIGGGISVNAGSYNPVCVNASAITLAGTPSGGTFSGTGVNGNSFNPGVGAGTYPVTYSYTDANGCSGQNTTNIIVNPLPSVNAGTYSPLCANGNAITLNGSPAGGNFSGTGVTGNSFNPAVGAGNYILTYQYTNANGCSNSGTTTVLVNQVPNVSAGVYNQVCSDAAIVNLNGTPSGGTWNGTGVNGSTFNPAVGAGTYTLTYTYTDGNGCSNAATAIQKVNALPVVSAGSYPGACDKSANINLSGTPSGGIWNGQGVSGNTFITSSVIPGTYPVTYSYTDANGCSNSSSVNIVVHPLPTVSFSGLASTYNVSASSVTLTGSPVGGTFSGQGMNGNVFSPAVAGVGGPYTISYVYTDVNGCSNVSSMQTTVTSCIVPSQPGSITAAGGNTKVCPGDSKTYSIQNVAGATTYTWTAPAGGNIVSGQGTTSITINYTASFTASGTLSVVAGSACGTGAARTLAITRNTPSTPSVISGLSSAVCAGSIGNYSVTNVAGITYNWTAPANATITAGQGSNSVTVNFSGAFISGSITVSANNGCGTSSLRSLSLTSKPATPSVISGLSNTVCASTSGTYSVTNIAGVIYNWTAPPNATISSGQGTNSVVINFSAAFTSGSLIVAATNACGSSTNRTLTIASVPAMPGTLSGATSNLCNGSSLPYSVSPVANASGYNWTLPASASIATNNGNAITVNYGVFNSGQVCVSSMNTCGNSAPRCVSVQSKPSTPASITGPSTVCANQTSINYSCATQTGATYTWLLPAGASIVSGQGTGNITANWGTVAGNVRVTPSNACGNASSRLKAVTITCRESFASGKSDFNIVPNPASTFAVCNYFATENGKVKIEFRDLTGRLISNYESEVVSGENKIDLNILGLSKGIYLVAVKQSTYNSNVIKFIVE